MAAPEVLTIPTMPQSRLKALLQANAVLHAVLSACCFIFRSTLFAAADAAAATATSGSTNASNKDEVLACSLGFALAFHAVFLFRIAMRQHVSNALVAVATVTDFFAAGAIVVAAALHLVHASQPVLRFLLALSVLQALCGVGLVVLTYVSTHGYMQPEAVAV